VPVGPLCHCHDNPEAFVLSQVIMTIWTIRKVKSLLFSKVNPRHFELFLSHSFIAGDKRWKVQLFTDLQRLRLLPNSSAPQKSNQQLEHFLLFLALFSFLHFRGKNSDYSWSAFLRQTTQSCMILPPPAVQIGRLSAKLV